MSAARGKVAVRVPASTSNCGAGFDTLGLALTLYNRVTIGRADGTAAQPERASDAKAQKLVSAAAEGFFQAAGRLVRGFRFRIEGDVPAARGLGSSATIIAGVLAGLNALHGTGLGRTKLVEIATALEGNPDNVSPCILGGFTVSRCDPATGAHIDTIKVDVSDTLRFVVASPDVETLTKESRAQLPVSVPFFDAAKSINSAAYFTAALATGDFAKLRHAVGDFMHEPYRLPKIPGAKAAIEAGIAAGALTGWLSGSGSSVLCVAEPPKASAVSAAMCAAFARESVPCAARTLSVDNDGLKIE